MTSKRAQRSDIDEKDRDYDFSKPPLINHTITCKECNQKKIVKLQYTRLCNKCRNNEKNRKLRRFSGWQNWDNNGKKLRIRIR